MQKLSNETKILLNEYEMTLHILQAMLEKSKRELFTTLQEDELSYVEQHMQQMLHNIQRQITWCKRFNVC